MSRFIDRLSDYEVELVKEGPESKWIDFNSDAAGEDPDFDPYIYPPDTDEEEGLVADGSEFREVPRDGDGRWTRGGGGRIPPPPGRAGGRERPAGVLPDVPFDDVQIAYRPRHPDGHADPGEIVWAKVPFEEDPTQAKDRPVLIIGRTKDGKNLVGVQLTSKPGKGDRTSVGSGNWDRTGRESYLKLDRFVQIDEKNYRREGDYVKKPKFQGIVDELTQKQHAPHVALRVFDLPRPL